MSLKVRAALVLVIGTVMGLSLALGGGLLTEPNRQSEQERVLEHAALLAEVMERVKRDYVESVDDRDLLEAAIRGMVGDLDPHSEYLNASEYRDIRNSTIGSYTGVGIEISELDGVVTVITPMLGSPAARSGIRRGDKIVAVDGRAIEPNNLRDVLGQLRGPTGSRVEITVERDAELIEHTMRREQIRVASVSHQLLSPAYGYVRLSEFTDSTSRELSQAVDTMQDESGSLLAGLVLDLRNNPGGVLDAAVDVSDLFLNDGIIVTADGRTDDARFRRDAHRGDILDGANIVVLVNDGSASASEIVAGALQDHGRALIVGTRTFGKGLVQTVMPLSRGRAVKLTTSRYYTPSGDSIHGTGVTPDVHVEDTSGFPDMSLNGFVDRENDVQLVEALERLSRPNVMHSKAE